MNITAEILGRSASSALTLLSRHPSHAGWQAFYRHDSTVIGLPMRFAAYISDSAVGERAGPCAVQSGGG